MPIRCPREVGVPGSKGSETSAGDQLTGEGAILNFSVLIYPAGN